MIYVDPLVDNGWILRGHKIKNCHMWSDTSTEELVAFAKKIGLKSEWLQRSRRLIHFDLTPNRRKDAVLAGAKEISFSELKEMIRRELKERRSLKN